jgi:hypothetical protein
LSIGNLTSQFLANVYLNPCDHFVKEELRCRFYTHYGLFCNVIASVSQRSNPLKIKRLLRQKAPRNHINLNPKRVYIRYVDDAVFLDNSTAYLESLVPRLQDFLNPFRLKIFLQKCQIRPTACGQRFLGQVVFPQYRLLAPENVRRFARRLRRFQRNYAKRKIDLPEIRQSLMSWLGHAQQANTWALRRDLMPRLAVFPSRNVLIA